MNEPSPRTTSTNEPAASTAKKSTLRSTLTLGDRIGLSGAIAGWVGVLVVIVFGVIALVDPLSSGQTVDNAIGNASIINRGTIIYNEGSSGSESTTPPVSCPQPSLPTPSPGNHVFITMDVKSTAVPATSQCWGTRISASPAVTVRYLITYDNDSTAAQNNVVIRVNLAPGMTLVPNSTHLTNETNPSGILYYSNNIVSGGIIVGSYGPGADAFVVFSVTVPFVSVLNCGPNQFRSVGVARPDGLDEFYNTADVNVMKTC